MLEINSFYDPIELPTDRSFPEFFFRRTREFDNKTALIWPSQNVSYSFKDVRNLANSVSKHLSSLGARKGTIIGSYVQNRPEFFIFLLAAQKIGAIIATCNPSYTVDETLAQFRDCGIDMLYTDAHTEKIEKLIRQLPFIKVLIHTDSQFLTSSSSTAATVKVFSFSQMTNEPNVEAIEEEVATAPNLCLRNSPALILYSSGTSGLPKGVIISHFSLMCSLQLTSNMHNGPKAFEISKTDACYVAYPIFHAGGILAPCVCLVQGATVVIGDRFYERDFLATIQDVKITKAFVPPPILVFLTKSPLVTEYDISSLNTIFVSSAPVSKELAVHARDAIGISNIVQMFGLTESGMCPLWTPIDDHARSKIGSCGILTPNCKAKIVDIETQKSLGPHEQGELWLHVPCVFSGYLNNPSATQETFTADGWLKTGDICYYDKDNYFYVVDRLKELIKVRGFQVAPAELEAVILTHPAVLEVIVIGIKDSYSGELPKAFVILKESHKIAPNELQDFVRGWPPFGCSERRNVQLAGLGKLASYKQLNGGVEIVTSLPKTASGKPMRRLLREQAEKHKSKI